MKNEKSKPLLINDLYFSFFIEYKCFVNLCLTMRKTSKKQQKKFFRKTRTYSAKKLEKQAKFVHIFNKTTQFTAVFKKGRLCVMRT